MYCIYADGVCFYNDVFALDNMKVINPKLVLEDSAAGSLSITIPPTNLAYKTIVRMVTDISVTKDGTEIWAGRVLSESKDFWNNRVLLCEGELAFFNDSTQPPAEYHDQTVRGFLETLVNIHNSKVAKTRQFTVGAVTVTDSNDSLYRYTNYEKTIECINKKLVERLGGHLRVRKVDGVRYLDYLSDYPNTNSQTIEFGKNLLDFTRKWDLTEFATVILPLGNRLEESPIEALDAYLTVESVNNGSIYVQSASAVSEYGWIEKVVNWDDVSTASALLTKAKAYLEDIQFDNMDIELSALDLHYLNVDYEAVKLLDEIRVISKPHGMDRYFPVTKLEIPLDQPENTQFILGDTVRTTLTSTNNKISSEILNKIETLPKSSSILEEARANATAIMNMATNGYITITQDANGTNTFYVSNDLDYTKATKLWKWNLNGLGYSDDSGETYSLAMTMDGQIVGGRLVAGSVSSEKLSVEYTTQVTEDIENAMDKANEYTDEQAKSLEETISISISNLENRIALQVVDTKEAISQKNYVTNGESETITLDGWTISGTAATVEVAEYQNISCLKFIFAEKGLVSFTQSIGTIPAGNYTIQMQAAFEEGTQPNYIQCGLSDRYDTMNFSEFTADTFKTVKNVQTLSASNWTVYGGVYGYSGSVVYITNIRCLRDYQELLDDLQASLAVSIGEISASVSDLYENSQHDYCVNGDFSDTDDAFSSWTKSNSSYVTAEEYADKSCACIANPSSTRAYFRQVIEVLKTGTFKVRFKAACASGYESTARIRVSFGGVSKYTSSGQLTTEWQTFEFDFDDVEAGSKSLYFYNYIYSTTIYITDVEVLGYTSSYNEAMILVNAGNIDLKVDKDGVISAINLSGEDATISADKINLEGAVTISSLNSNVKTKLYSTSGKTLYGTCTNAAATKAVTCTDATELTDGLTVQVKFTYANTASSPKLNVNSLGAKSIYFNGAVTSATNQFKWAAGTTITFVYATIDDTGYWVPQGYPRSYFGTSITEAGASEKTADISDFVLCTGTSVTITFDYATSVASPTLNISSTGKRTIYAYKDSLSETSTYNWKAGATVEFTFDGQFWQIAGNTADGILTNWCINNDATLINGAKIATGTLLVDQIKLYGEMTVYKAADSDITDYDTIGGTFGYRPGATDTEETDGIGIYNGESEIVATTAGVKMTRVNTTFVAIDNRATIVSPDTSKGQIVLESGKSISMTAGSSITASPAISTTSDERLKTDFGTLDGYEGLFDSLDPVSYRYTNRPGKRYLGFTTQSVAAALEENGLDPEEYGLLGEWQDDNGDTYGTLAYTELIAVLWHEVQQLRDQIKTIESSIAG